MKKRLKHAKDLSIGDQLKFTGYIWEIDDVVIDNDKNGSVEVQAWLWASPRKRITLKFSDKNFPVTVR
jgi:hypothetical protein